jgi:Mg-chelatase subunit ChlD
MVIRRGKHRPPVANVGGICRDNHCRAGLSGGKWKLSEKVFVILVPSFERPSGMKIICVHCGGQFTITAEQLGGKGRCPHCRGEIALPKPEEHKPAAPVDRPVPTNWLENSFSGLASLVIHMSLLLAIALFQTEGGSGEGMSEEVLIGVLPSEQLSDHQEQELSTAEVKKDQQAEDFEQLLEVEPPTSAAEAAASGELSAAALSPSVGRMSDAGALDLGAVQIGGGSMAGGGGNWDGMLQSLRRNGLDIVICFDSTGSMSGEISEVKKQIERIGTTLLTLVPKARISICTYRDNGDDYVVKGLPLSGSIQDIQSYLAKIEAGGGGDHPEAVEEGLYWSVMQNKFRPSARKVILLFGDAPPHEDKLKRCRELARSFREKTKGIVSTVTCRADAPLPEFYEIASIGGGEAFLSADQRQIVSQLIVLVFGSRHRSKVLEAFKLLEK